MNDPFNFPQTALVIGGTSEIALAIVDRLAQERLHHVVLAARDAVRAGAAATQLRQDHPRLVVDHMVFEAADVESHPRLIQAAVNVLGDIDLVLIAAGMLGTPDAGNGPLGDWRETVDVTTATYSGAVSALHLAANRLHEQGHGSLIVISSVAALRPRRTNPAYGAAKAALDGFTLALNDRFHGSGVQVLLVRPGFVRTRMTEGLGGKLPPMSTTASRVGDDVIDALQHRRRVVWSPRGVVGPGYLGRLLPSAVLRRLPW